MTPKLHCHAHSNLPQPFSAVGARVKLGFSLMSQLWLQQALEDRGFDQA